MFRVASSSRSSWSVCQCVLRAARPQRPAPSSGQLARLLSSSPAPPQSSPSPDSPPSTHTSPDSSVLTDGSSSSATGNIADSWHPFDLVSQLVENVHLATGMPYWAVIIGTTLAVRLCTVPLGVKAVQNSARMAAIRPRMNKLIAYSKENPNNNTYQKELFLLWKNNNVNPLKALVVPIVQLPLFITFFFGVRQLGNYYPGVAEGGILWFSDLACHDPYFILPILNASSFLLMVELNSHDQAMETDQTATFKTAMRGLSLFMVPVTMYAPASVFMYWIPNNFISLAQTRVLKTAPMKKLFNIPDPPPVDPYAPQEENAIAKIQKAWKSTFSRGREVGHVEIIDGDGGNMSEKSSTPVLSVPKTPPPTTYKQKPSKKSKQK